LTVCNDFSFGCKEIADTVELENSSTATETDTITIRNLCETISLGQANIAYLIRTINIFV
jgi:hypothetical protein